MQVVILDRDGDRNPLYTSWISGLASSCVFVSRFDADWTPPQSCGLLVTAQHYNEPEFGILRRAVEKETPTLIVADGILEYRNTWMNPGLAPGSLFQPVVGHKIACLGRSQARVLESWGNLGKCEIVGSPRFDRLKNRRPLPRASGEAFRCLIMTAKNPGFTPEQTALVKRSVQDLKFWFAQHPQLNGTSIEAVWRLTQGLDKEIGVENRSTDELRDLLPIVDAVITTPSTVMLEAMLHGLPTALLDYNNLPHYVPAAWTITAPRQIGAVIAELLEPPAAKMLYQDTVLHDSLECRTPAAPRMAQLAEDMLRIGADCHASNKRLAFPRRILTDAQDGHHVMEERFDLQKLYPEHPVFTVTSVAALHAEIGILRREVERLKKTLAAMNYLREILSYIPGPRKIARLWRESRRRRAAYED